MPVVRRLSVVAVVVTTLAACSSGQSAEPPSAEARAVVPDEPGPGPSTEAAGIETAPSTTTTSSTTSTPPYTTTTSAPAPSTSAAPPDTARDFSGIDPVVSAFVAQNDLNGAGLVVVDRDDGIVHEDYWGEFDADRVSLVASSSKMITAGVLMKLHDDGVLQIDAPVSEIVPWGAGYNERITTAQLLSNSSGLPGLFSPATVSVHVCQFLAGTEIEECGAAAFQTVLDDPLTVAPDTEFRYGGVQWQIAGAVAETASGKTWAQLIDEIYIQPCGVTSLGYANQWLGSVSFDYPTGIDLAAASATENPNMEGGAFITPPDYAALLLMHLRGGECPNGRVMSAEAIADLHEDRVLADYGDAGVTQPGYGMGWWVDRASGQISDSGAYGSVPWLDLDDGYGVYLVLEADAGLGGRLAGLLNPVIHTAMTADA